MPVLCFVIDTSASMNQKTSSGQRIIDIAKKSVDNFVSKVRSKDPSARSDQYVLITTSREDGLRVGLKDSPSIFSQELKNLRADGLSDLGFAIQSAFDLLNVERHENDLDSFGRGRLPWMIKPSAVIVVTDGGKLSSLRSIKSEIGELRSKSPGAELVLEPFRWDQRVFGLLLKFNSHTDSVDNTDEQASNTSILSGLCDDTGGKSFTVTSSVGLQDTLQSIGQKIQSSSGVIMNFEKIPEKNGIRPELSNGIESKNWHKTKGMVFVRPNYKTGTFQGFWPIPESFWPDQDEAVLPSRSAHPVLKFSTKDVKPFCLINFAFDKLELEPSPLTSAMLERKRPDVCWQVFVDGSDTLGSLGKPIGYLKPNSENKIVNLFIHPYNYEVALGLIDDLLRMNLSPSQQWKTLWEEYLKDIPGYYIPYLRKALTALRPPVPIIPDSFESKHLMNLTVQNHMKKIKTQLRVEMEKYVEQLRHCRANSHMEKAITVRNTESDQTSEVANFILLNNHQAFKQPLLEAFDVRRDAVCSALSRMRAAFRQCLSGGIQLHKEHLLHQQPQGTMGNYQDYVKNLPPPLRDPDPDAKTVKTTFGNPWKRGRQSDSLDVDGFGFDGMEDTPGRRTKPGQDQVPKKRRRRLSITSLKEKKDRPIRSPMAPDFQESDESGWSDTNSDSDPVFQSDDEPRIPNGLPNGFSDGYNSDDDREPPKTNGNGNLRVNGNGIGHQPVKISHKLNPDDRFLRTCTRLIRTPGTRDKDLVKELNSMESHEFPSVSLMVKRLQLDAIRFKRHSFLQILDGYLHHWREAHNANVS